MGIVIGGYGAPAGLDPRLQSVIAPGQYALNVLEFDSAGLHNTNAKGMNGLLAVRQYDGLVPYMPNISGMYAANQVSTVVNRYGVMGLAGPLIQLGDNANPATPSKIRFTVFGSSFGIVVDTSTGFMPSSNTSGMLPVGMLIKGRAYQIKRTVELTSTALPFGQNKNMAVTIIRDISDENTPYVVEVRAEGDRNNVISNRLWINSFLVSPMCAAKLTGLMASYPVTLSSSTSPQTVNSWLAGAQPINVVQMDVYNTSGSSCVFSLLPDGTTITNTFTLAAGECKSVFSNGGAPSIQSFGALKVQQSVASALRLNIYSTQGY